LADYFFLFLPILRIIFFVSYCLFSPHLSLILSSPPLSLRLSLEWNPRSFPPRFFISLHFSSFLFISLHFSSFLFISLHFFFLHFSFLFFFPFSEDEVHD